MSLPEIDAEETPRALAVLPSGNRPAPIGPAPVGASERLATLDAVRGVALLGILVMNIMTFGWPGGAEMNPSIPYYEPAELAAEEAGGPSAPLRRGPAFGRLDMAQWAIARVLVEDKMRGLFTMLFGAGLVLFASRAEARGRRPFWLFFRRIVVLAIIGAIHGYLIWDGDILFLYATVGLFSYPFRSLSPGRLMTLGTALFLFSVAAVVTFGVGLGWVQAGMPVGSLGVTQAGALEPLQEIREELAQDDDFANAFKDNPRENTKEIELFRSTDYVGQMVNRAQQTFGMQIFSVLGLGFLFLSGWLSLMGMGLMKAGFFQGGWTDREYWRVMVAGYLVGLPLAIWGTALYFRFENDLAGWIVGPFTVQLLAVPALVLAHASAIILLVKSGRVRWLTDRLAAVGQMALTNYLMQSVLATAIFYGYGLGWFGMLSRVQLMGVVAGIWLFQLLLSPVWLTWFRFGPAEWLWRTFTYLQWQPLERPDHATRLVPLALRAGRSGEPIARLGPVIAGPRGADPVRNDGEGANRPDLG